MADYINSSGKALGPIQLGSNGSWLLESNLPVYNSSGQILQIKHLNVTLNKNADSNNLVIVRGRTPSLETFLKDGKRVPCCDLRSLVTAEWVIKYCETAGNGISSDLSLYITHGDLEKLKITLESANNANSSQMQKLEQELGNQKTILNNLQNTILGFKWPSPVWIRCGGASPVTIPE